MKRILFLLMCVMAFATQWNGYAQIAGATYSDLPIERRMLFNMWQPTGDDPLIDCGDYSSWTHLDDSNPGRTDALKALLSGKDHEFKVNGKKLWSVQDTRLGTYSFFTGNTLQFIEPQYFSFGAANSHTNWQANLHNTVGAFIETPICDGGVGYIYFDAVNTYSDYPVSIKIDWTTNRLSSAGSVYPLTSNIGTNYWHTLTTFTVNGQTRVKERLQVTDPVIIRIIRTDKTISSGATTHFLAVDNICLSYPTAPVTVSDPIATKVSGVSDRARIACTVSNVGSIGNGESTDYTCRSATLFYKSWDEQAYFEAPMRYQVGSGDGKGNDETWEAEVEFPKGTETERITYYVVVNVNGSVNNRLRYLPVDYTLQNRVTWDTSDGAEPPESFLSNEKTTDVSGWIVTQITSKLPIDRLMLFNAWEETDPDTGEAGLVDFGDYYGGGWTHLDPLAPGRATPWLLPGTNHVFYGESEKVIWEAIGARLGTYSYQAATEMIPPQEYSLANTTVTNHQAILVNVERPMITSPYYTNGIGTLYFDAINNMSEFPVEFTVEIATNMVDLMTGWPTNVMYETDQHFTTIDGETGEEVSHHLALNWVPLSTNVVNCADTGGSVFRYQNRLLYRDPIRFRIVRTSQPESGAITKSYLSIDNIQVSPPPADVVIAKDEMTFIPPYPAKGQTFNIRCRVSNRDMNVPTTHESRAVYVHYRWRYLDQQVDDFTTVLMDYIADDPQDDGEGNNELYSVGLPAQEREGDLEYYFECVFDGFRFKPVDYTQTGYLYLQNSPEKGTESLSPRTLHAWDLAEEEIPVADRSEFARRIRDARSIYEQLYIVTDRHADPIEMVLMDDEVWWGWIPLNQAGVTIDGFRFNFMGVGKYLEETQTVSDTPVYWAEVGQESAAVPPSGGKCVETDEYGMMTVSVGKVARFVLVKFDLNKLDYTICRADFQNFNKWVAFDYFSQSDGQSTKISYDNNFGSWPVNEDTVMDQYYVDTTTSGAHTNHYYVGYETYAPTWMARGAKYVYERTKADGKNKPSGITYDTRNIALRLMGGANLLDNDQGITELGSVSTTRASLTDGVKYITFKARAGLSFDPGRIAYYTDTFFTQRYYRVTCNFSVNAVSPEEHSVSLIGLYSDDNNFYELRITQMVNPNNLTENWLLMELFNWVEGEAVRLGNKRFNGTIGSTYQAEIDFSNTRQISARYGTESLTISHNGHAARRGTVGILSQDCVLTCTGMTFYPTGSTTGISLQTTTTKPNWNGRGGLYTINNAQVTSKTPSQTFGIYAQATKFGDTGNEPDSALSAWTLKKTFTVTSFSYANFTYQPEDWEPQFIRFQVLAGGYDVAFDEITTASWHGRRNKTEGIADNSSWIATESWVVANTSGTNHIVQLDHSRADPGDDPDQANGQTQGIQSLRLTRGSGSLEFDYRVKRAPVKMTVQWKDQFVGAWEDVGSTVITTTSDRWAHTSFYVGNTNGGYIRVVNDRRGGANNDQLVYTNGFLEVTNITAWDEPYVDTGSWKVYNAKVSDTDRDRIILDGSRACFLNNDPQDGCAPKPQDQYEPHVQAPLLEGGLGEIHFDARLYHPSDSMATIYIMATEGDWYSTEGWRQIGRIDVTSPYYTHYEFNAGQGGEKWKGVRLETTRQGGSRVCLENVSVSEPVYPGFDIGGTRPICQINDTSYNLEAGQQPLQSDKVGLEARLSNMRMSPTNIRVFVDYYVGTNVWGVENWYGKQGCRTLELFQATDDPQKYRTKVTDDLGFFDAGDIIQYRVRANYTDERQTAYYTATQSASGFTNPSWYEPLDFNKINAAKGWSPYFIIYDIPKGTVFINEINVYEPNTLLTSPETTNRQYALPYVEIAVPETSNLNGWKLMFMRGTGLETTNTYRFAQITQKSAVTNGYAFYVVSVDEDKWRDTFHDYIPTMPEWIDYGVSGFIERYAPKFESALIALYRPMGMIEHLVAYDPYGPNTLTEDRLAQFADQGIVYAGIDRSGSVDVIRSNGSSSSHWLGSVVYTNEETNAEYYEDGPYWTPGKPNVGQVLPDIPAYFAGVSNVVITAMLNNYTLATQNDLDQKLSFKVKRGSATNIVYKLKDWYRIGSLTTNGVNALNPAANQGTEYVLDLPNLQTNITVNAVATVAPELMNGVLPQVRRWVMSYPDTDLAPSTYNGKPMSLTELYWFNVDPTVSHVFEGRITDFMYDPDTNLFMTAYLTIDGNNCTSLNYTALFSAGAKTNYPTFKVKARMDLMSNDIDADEDGWIFLSQYAIMPDSFDENHTCRLYLENPFKRKLFGKRTDSLFLKWQIEFDQESDWIQVLTNSPIDPAVSP